MVKSPATTRVGTDESAESGRYPKNTGPRQRSLVAIVAIGVQLCFLVFLVFLGYVCWQRLAGATPPTAHRESPTALAESPKPIAKSQPIVQRGQLLYHDAGCDDCHGLEGKGGVTNPNSINGTFSSLKNMAAKLSLVFPEDVEVVLKWLKSDNSLKDLSRPNEIAHASGLDEIPHAAEVAAKYEIIAKIIFEGTQACKADENGPEPIEMDSFRDVLTESEMNEIIASFLIMYPIEEEESKEGQEK